MKLAPIPDPIDATKPPDVDLRSILKKGRKAKLPPFKGNNAES